MAYLFSNPGYISVGDKYVSSKPKSDREKGRQFVTAPTKKGLAGKGVLFGKYEYVSEKYTDPGTHERKYQKTKSKQQNIQPFKCTSPSQRPSGSGAYFGTIGKKFEHLPEYDVIKKGEKKTVTHQKRNIITNPPKKGTYGYVGTTLQKDLFKRGEADPYDNYRQVLNKEKKEAKKKLKGQPFKSACKKLDYFSSPTVGALNEKGNLPPKRVGNKAQKKKIAIPWKPSCPVVTQKHIEYISDPYDKEKKKSGKENRPIFKPTGTTKSGPTRSIIFKDL